MSEEATRETKPITDEEITELEMYLNTDPPSLIVADTLSKVYAPNLIARIRAAEAELAKCRRKLAEAGVEGSPPPGSEGTIPSLITENRALQAELAATTSAWAAAADERDQRNSELAAIRLYLGVPEGESAMDWLKSKEIEALDGSLARYYLIVLPLAKAADGGTK